MEAELPLTERDWSIGAIIGPSGSGKTSLAHEIWQEPAAHAPHDWPQAPIIDALAPEASYDEVTGLLTAAGLGSIPAWLRPFHCLSIGEQFRAGLAAILADQRARVVVDEFTSTVDRRNAKSGSAAFAKAWRKQKNRQLIAVTAHRDIVDWLQPDWIFDTAKGAFQWRCLRRRPKIKLDIFQTNWRYWPYFEPHHYLKLPHLIAATNYVGFVGDEPVAHIATTPVPGVKELRAARFVVRPECQGLGLGMRFINEVAALIRRGVNKFNKALPTLICTSHPGLVRAMKADRKWRQVTSKLVGGSRKSPAETCSSLAHSPKRASMQGHFRPIQSFRYLEQYK